MNDRVTVDYGYAYGEMVPKIEGTLYMRNGGRAIIISLPKKLNKLQQFMYKKCFGLDYMRGEYRD